MATFNKRGYKEPKPKAEKLDNNLPDPNLPAKIRNQLTKKKEKKPKLIIASKNGISIYRNR